MAELVAAGSICEVVVMDILQGAAGRSPDPDTQKRCFACLAAFVQRAELLDALHLNLSLLSPMKDILTKILPEVDAALFSASWAHEIHFSKCLLVRRNIPNFIE